MASDAETWNDPKPVDLSSDDSSVKFSPSALHTFKESDILPGDSLNPSNETIRQNSTDSSKTFQTSDYKLPEITSPNEATSHLQHSKQQNEPENQNFDFPSPSQHDPEESTILARFVPKAGKTSSFKTSQPELNPNQHLTKSSPSQNQLSEYKKDDEKRAQYTGNNLNGVRYCKNAETDKVVENNKSFDNNLHSTEPNLSGDATERPKDGIMESFEEVGTSSDLNLDTGVTTVLGSGHSPANDPDHSMLKFAVFEVQDLTEELKKLKNLLDTLSEVDYFGNKNVEEDGEMKLGSILDSRPEENVDKNQFKVDDLEESQDFRLDAPQRDEGNTGCSEDGFAVCNISSESRHESWENSFKIECKSQLEASGRNGNKKCLEIHHFPEGRRILKGYSQEIAAAVK